MKTTIKNKKSKSSKKKIKNTNGKSQREEIDYDEHYDSLGIAWSWMRDLPPIKMKIKRKKTKKRKTKRK